MEWALAIVGLALLGVAAVSGRLSGTPVTLAMVFVAVGVVVGPRVLHGVDLPSTGATVQTLAEATLALVLFCDFSRVDLPQLRADVGPPLRLLGVGLPLTIALGAVAAAAIFGALTIELVRAASARQGAADGKRPGRGDTGARTRAAARPRASAVTPNLMPTGRCGATRRA
jgi:NhaP-type Na+/H+ or K+/H+ antiporter